MYRKTGCILDLVIHLSSILFGKLFLKVFNRHLFSKTSTSSFTCIGNIFACI